MSDEQDLYSIKNYVQSNVGGELTDYQILKEQAERNKELAKLRQTPQYKKRRRDAMIKLQDNIEHARNAVCPHCKRFSLLQYADGDPSQAYIEGIAKTSGVRGILTERYGPNPALHSHIANSHPQILEQMKKKQEITKLYRNKLASQRFLDARIPWPPTGDKEKDAEAAWGLRQFAMSIKADPRFELEQVGKEIKNMEKHYPFLKEEKKKYEEELRSSPYSY